LVANAKIKRELRIEKPRIRLSFTIRHQYHFEDEPYKRLLKYNEFTVDIGAGSESWREFATHADYDTLALAIQQAQRFYENLEATRSCALPSTLASVESYLCRELSLNGSVFQRGLVEKVGSSHGMRNELRGSH